MSLCFISLLPYLIHLSTSIILDILQPSLVIWQNYNSSVSLLITSINIDHLVLVQKINSLPFQVRVDSITQKIVSFSQANASIYQSLGVVYEGSVKYYYQSDNGQTEAKILNISIQNSQINQKISDNIQNNFVIYPTIISSSSSSMINKSILLGTDMEINQNIYIIPNNLYSYESQCGVLSSISSFMIDNYQICRYLSPSQIINNKLYLDCFFNTIQYNDNGVLRLRLPKIQIPIKLVISKEIDYSEILVRKLAEYRTNLSELFIQTKIKKEGNNYGFSILITNNGSQILYIEIKCFQGLQRTYQKYLLLYPKQIKQFFIQISKNSPDDDLHFNITNLFNQEFVMVTQNINMIINLSKIDYNQLINHINPSTFITLKLVIQILCGILILFVLNILRCIYNKRKQKKKQKQFELRVIELKSLPTQKQIVKDIPDMIPSSKIKQKSQTLTTLDSQQHQNSQNIFENKQNVPSLQDKLQIKENIDELERSIGGNKSNKKRKHRRGISSLPIITPEKSSEECVNARMSSHIENLENQKVW